MLLRSPLYTGDAIWRYYHALATFHLGEIAVALAEFSALRSLTGGHPAVYTLRNFFVGKEGFPKLLQGVFRRSHERKYVSLLDLDIDTEASEAPASTKEGSTLHCYLAFRLAGHRAYFGDPSRQDLEIPFDDDFGGEA